MIQREDGTWNLYASYVEEHGESEVARAILDGIERQFPTRFRPAAEERVLSAKELLQQEHDIAATAKWLRELADKLEQQ